MNASQAQNANIAYVKKMINLSVRGLSLMFDRTSALFSYRRLKLSDGTLINEGLSVRYTLITLLGLSRLQSFGAAIPFDIRSIATPLIMNLSRQDNIGDLGLLLWFAALVMPETVERILPRLSPEQALSRFTDGKEKMTMELSWVLTGLSYTALLSNEMKTKAQRSARAIFTIVKANYGGNGIFAHCRCGSVFGSFRDRMGSFADQVYPAYAFATYARAYGDVDAQRIAIECAQKIAILQGPLGQWWWHYDAVHGTVVGRYPVYSVHQEGMAPMFLFAVGELSGIDFTENIYRGLRWNNSANELGYNMVDDAAHIIWRNIYRNKVGQRIEESLGLIARIPHGSRTPKGLRVLFEGRSYCLGWLLYAFANHQT